MFDHLRSKIFYSIKFSYFYTKNKETKCNGLHFIENMCKEVTSPMSGYQCQSKGARFTKKIRH